MTCFGRSDAFRLVLPLSALVVMASPGARADQIAVDWSDPEIQAFAQSSGNAALAADLAAKVAALKLPVLAFASVPQLVTNAAPAGQAPVAPTTRQVIMDAANPTWYQVNDQYGDITISVLASLTVNRDVAKSTLYQAPPPTDGKTPSDPRISVFNESGDSGFAGLIVEYTVYKYPNIPYTVTIECAQALKDKCSDLSVITKDRDLLKLIAATPPPK